jgi:hypothetical protein
MAYLASRCIPERGLQGGHNDIKLRGVREKAQRHQVFRQQAQVLVLGGSPTPKVV